MSVTNCPNGHFYDDSLFSECPYCKKGIQQQVQSPGNTEFAGAMLGNNPQIPEMPNRKTRIVSVAPLDNAHNAHNASASNSIGPKTQMYYDISKYSSDPAAGWLVCVNGPDKGKDFYVITEKTLIGRSGAGSYKVDLNDEKISRNSAIAVIVYLQDTRSFMISPVPSGNLLISVNGGFIHGPIELHDNDRIRVGDTVLVFVSFCNQHFDWDTYEVKYPPKS